MSDANKLALMREMLESAEAALRSAKQILADLTGGQNLKSQYTKMAKSLPPVDETGGQIIEGVFDGQHMIGPDGKTYPVPANYASKSKLIPGDVLKLTIGNDGAFLYKQIGPVERKRVIGPLIYEDGQYKVLAKGKAYKVLLASVTYFHGEVGDMITLIVPELEESDWGAIENVIPKQSAHDAADVQTEVADFE